MARDPRLLAPDNKRLSSFEKFEYAKEWLLEVRERRNPSEFELRDDLETVVVYWRGLCALKDPIWDIRNNFHIKDEITRLPVLYGHEEDYAQNLLWDSIEKDRLAGKPARKLGVKPRRIRWSSAALAYGLEMAMRNYGHGAAIVAHDEPTARELFDEVAKFAWDKLPEPRPKKRFSTRRELEFEDIGSKVRVGTAGGGAGAFAGFALMFAQWSEAFRYEEMGADAADLITNMLQTMPPSPAFTVGVIEGTGRGQRGYAYRKAKQAHEDPSSSEWDLLFVPAYRRPNAKRWFCAHELKSRSRCDCRDSKDARSVLLVSLTEEERLLIAPPHDASLEFINWRRHQFTNEIEGETYAIKRRKLLQDHPSTFQDCFQASGASVFDPDLVNLLMKHPRCLDFGDFGHTMEREKFEKPTRGELIPPAPMWSEVEGVTEITPMPKFKARSDGELYVIKPPVRGHRYGIAIDLASGVQSDDRDWHAAPVLDRDTFECVALYYSQRELSEWLTVCRLLSKWYNDGFLGPEVLNVDTFTASLAKTDRRGMLYVRKDAYDAVNREFREQFGWKTSNANKMSGVSTMADWMEKRPQFFTFRKLLEECLTLSAETLKSGRVRVEAQTQSDHDDVWQSSEMLLQMHGDMPMIGGTPEDTRPDDKPPSFSKMVEDMMRWQRGGGDPLQGAADFDSAMD